MIKFSFTSPEGVTDFTTHYPESIDFSKSKYEAALIELSMYNSIENIKRILIIYLDIWGIME